MVIKHRSADYMAEKHCGEEMQAFLGDLQCLSPSQLKLATTMTYMMMQLKRFTRDELKDLLGHELWLQKQAQSTQD